MSSYKAAPLSRLDLRALAKAFRLALGHNETDPYVEIIRILEHDLRNILNDPDFRFEIVPYDEMPNAEGLAIVEQNRILIREDVYDRACEGSGRDRLTIAHEIAHYLLHDGTRLSLARATRNEKVPAYRDPEWQASCFAAELLMPAHLIKDMTVEEIGRRCKVSMQAAFYQKNRQ